MDSGGLDDRVLRGAIERAQDALLFFREDGSVAYANEACAFVFGWSPAELMAMNLGDLLHPKELERAALAVSRVGNMGRTPTRTHGLALYRRPDGSYRPVEIGGSPLRSADGERLFSLFGRRVDDRLIFDEVLTNFVAEPDLDAAMRPIPELLRWRPDGPLATIVWDAGAGAGIRQVGDVVPAALVGASQEVADGSPWAAAWNGEKPLRRGRNDDLGALGSALRSMAEDAGLAAFWIRPLLGVRDEVRGIATMWCRTDDHPPLVFDEPFDTMCRLAEVTLRWADQQAQLRHAASHDSLTGLANRAAFHQRIVELSNIEVDPAADTPSVADSAAVLLVDLDGFKPVNDAFGHAAGDAVLTEVGRRLAGVADRPDELVARLGGDEFGILLAGSYDRVRDRAAGVASQVVEVVSQPVAVVAQVRAEGAEANPPLGVTVEVGCSIGIAVGASDDVGQLVQRADGALYDAKAAGGRQWMVAGQ